MIKGIVGGAFIDVAGGTFSMPYISTDLNNPIQGEVRVCGNDFRVWDGDGWVQIAASYSTVSLNNSAQSAISWAMNKMAEEAALEQLSESHPAVKAAYENMKRAAEQLKVTIILSKDEQTTT
jgi:ferric-dicitrate binding protein FerR (iron transport regulator)